MYIGVNDGTPYRDETMVRLEAETTTLIYGVGLAIIKSWFNSWQTVHTYVPLSLSSPI